MKRLLVSLGATLLSLALCGACVETVVRLRGGKPEQPDRWRFSWVERGEIWRLEPGTRFRTSRGGHPVRINAHGFRDRAFLPAEPDTLRILVLGDSVTFGHGVAEEDTYTRRIEAMLAEEGRRARVLNAGIPGWSTHQEWLFYRDHAAELDVDVVLVGFVLNDVTEIQRGMIEIGVREGLFVIRGINWLAQHSAAVALLKTLLRVAMSPEELEVARIEGLARYPEAPHVKRAMERTADALLKIAALARERGDRFGLVLFPFHFQLRKPHLDAPQRFLEGVARENGLPVLDAMPALLPHESTDVFLDVDHLTPFGHEVVARAVLSWLAEAELLGRGGAEAAATRPR